MDFSEEEDLDAINRLRDR